MFKYIWYVPNGAQEAATPATGQVHKGGQHLCVPKEGCTKATCKGEKDERMDFQGHVETREQEGLCVTGDEGAGKYLEAEPSNRCKPQGRQEKEGRDNGRGGG